MEELENFDCDKEDEYPLEWYKETFLKVWGRLPR